MAEVNAKDLTTKTAPASTDSMLLFGTSTNEGAKITVDNLANNILERLTTKTFANQVGGSSAATILAQLATLNSNFNYTVVDIATDHITGSYIKMGKINLLIIAELKNLNASDYTVLDLPITQPVKSVSVDLKKANSSDTVRLQILESSSTKARVYNYTSDTGVFNIRSFVVWISAT